MRLWHTSMIKVLPREQLVAQWRELSAIAGAIQKNGTPNHILVNFVLEYDYDHFISYAYYVRAEMTKRKYKTMESVWQKITSIKSEGFNLLPIDDIYPEWHNNRYLMQCYYNLEEKYDCGGVGEEYFNKIVEIIRKKDIYGR